MKLKLLALGKMKRREYAELAEEYARRIGHYHSFDLVEIQDAPIRAKGDLKVALEEESKRIQKHLKPESCLIVLDEKGEQWTSVDLAYEMGELFNRHYSEIVFLIGGAYGIAGDLKEKARYQVSLTKLTLPHQLARVLLLEQIYRALTILKNVPYHHE